MRKLLAPLVLAVALAVPSSSMAQLAPAPQPLPDAACNQGTEQAREIAPETAHPHIPHDPGGPVGCHHRNPAVAEEL